MTVWFTADTHFGHDNIRRHCNRPFANVEEMDEKLIQNWNERIRPGDRVYHLGDFSWRGRSEIYRPRLNGHIILIMGNHDRLDDVSRVFSEVHELLTVRDLGRPIVLCHYALRVWNASHYGAYHLYGHSHDHLPPYGKSFDVGVDAQEYRPISLEEVHEKMQSLVDTRIGSGEQ